MGMDRYQFAKRGEVVHDNLVQTYRLIGTYVYVLCCAEVFGRHSSFIMRVENTQLFSEDDFLVGMNVVAVLKFGVQVLLRF